ncbi:MAG: TonB-dependent receptor [Bryobacterales bacterium]|nr:TonB-dependent receptor [Bryobacterales bacterium]
MRVSVCPLLMIILSVLPLWGQNTATLAGTAKDPAGNPVHGASIRLENALTGFAAETLSDAEGGFMVGNIPFHSYNVTISKAGFASYENQISLRSNIRVTLEVRLEIAGVSESVTVSERVAILVDPEETGTHLQMNESEIENLPLQVGNRGLEAVLVSFPGFAQNANGAIHARGAHNQMTFVIDGMPISDQLTGAFANAVDPNIVQTVELFTGNIPAEFGNKVSAVTSITTKSGLGFGRKFAGQAMLAAAGFGMLSQVTSVAGENGKFGYSATVNTMKTNRYLDAVSLENLHNGGNNERAFLRLDWIPNDRDIFRLNGIAGRSSFQLANLRSQHAAGMDQRQYLGDASGSFAWVRTIDAQTTFDNTFSYRTTQAQLFDSAGDTPVTATQARHLSTITNGSRFNLIRGRHTLRIGADLQRFPISEFFSFGIADPRFNNPAKPDFNRNLLPYDLSRGGRRFEFADQATGGFYAGFLQDNFRWGDFQVSLGLRYDNYRLLVKRHQLQPRLGLSYHLKATNTVFRASYNRLFQTPPNENLLLSASPLAAAIAPPVIAETLGSALAEIRPERQDFLEAGLQQGLGSRVSAMVTYYHKRSTDQQDNNNFLNTGIIFPITLKSIRVNGVEGRLSITPVRGFSGSLSVTHSRAISTPPFSGGLYIGNDAVALLSQGPFRIDHDQPLSVHGILTWTSRRGIFATLSTRYDSGLVANPSDPAQVAADPDFSDLLPYVRLNQIPARVKARTITDMVIGYERFRNERKLWEISAQVSNLSDATALYNFQSAFVGTRLVQPRTAGVRFRIFF